MDDGDQGCTLVALSTSGLYSEAGDGDQRGTDDGDHSGMVAAQGTRASAEKSVTAIEAEVSQDVNSLRGRTRHVIGDTLGDLTGISYCDGCLRLS